MSAEVLQALIDPTLASSAAVLLVCLLRKPMRAAVGARAAYWLWLLVPATTAAVLLPASSGVLMFTQVTLPEEIRSAFIASAGGEPTSNRAVLINFALAIWAVGACAMLFTMVARQRSFVRSLGLLTRDSDGLYRSDVIVAPMLVGAWNSKIVVPTDFERRYSQQERDLVVAHERAHEVRRDILINALASFALCLFWFNPLMYRALAWLRMDQELACDALVLSQQHSEVRQRYAEALLKTQLASESAWRQPVGCHWQSIHPLKERISMLKRPVPGRSRRLVGLAAIVAVTGVASYTAWAGQAANKDPSILIDLKVTISNPQANEVKALVTQYLVHSGEEIKDANGRPLDFACTPYLPDAAGRSTDWSDQKARGIPLPVAGQILLDCVIRRDNEVVNRPAVIVSDGKLGTIETAERNGPHRYRFDITASTSSEKIAAASKQSGNGGSSN